MMRKLWKSLLLAACGCLLAGMAAPVQAGDQDPLEVLVTILPHAGLVERLAGEAVRVHVLVSENQSPETYQPSPRELQALAGSTLWFTTGTPVESALRSRLQSMLPGLHVVPTHAELEVIDEHHCEHHDHDHDHGEMDPHVWVSPRNTARQAAVMAAALQERLPDRAVEIGAALQALQTELDQLDRELTALLEPVHGRTFYVFHPAFGYFARDYGLRQEAVESGGLAPSPRRLAELLRSLQAQGATTVYVQPQHSPQTVQPLAREAELKVVTLDPLAADHLANLRAIGESLRAGLEPRP
jgi:zinc transport system substrate-binding protein